MPSGEALNRRCTGVGRQIAQLPTVCGDNSEVCSQSWLSTGTTKGVYSHACLPLSRDSEHQEFQKLPKWFSWAADLRTTILCGVPAVPHRTEPQLPTELTCSWLLPVSASFPSLSLPCSLTSASGDYFPNKPPALVSRSVSVGLSQR